MLLQFICLSKCHQLALSELGGMTVALGGYIFLMPGCFFCTILLRERKRDDLVGFCLIVAVLRKPHSRKEKKKAKEEKKMRRRRRACFFWLLSPHSTAAAFVAPHKTPAGLPQHREKSQFCHAITWPSACSEKRHLTDLVKMLWHLSLPVSLAALLNHSLHFCLFTHYLWFYFFPLSTHMLFFPSLPLIGAFRSVFWNAPLLFPLSPIFFLFFSLSRVFRGVEASNSVTFLCCLCVCLCLRVSPCVDCMWAFYKLAEKSTTQ